MNIGQIEGVLRQRFADVQTEPNHFYRAVDRIGGQPSSVLLFDASGDISGDTFDFLHFQNEVIRKEYHRVNGSLQWNLYCYLLCEDASLERLRNSGRVTQIEEDRLYARKFVRTPEQLRVELSRREKSSTETAGLPADVGSLWSERCEEAGWSVLSSHESYTEIARKIEAGSVDVVTASETARTEAGVSIPTLNGLKRLRSDCFRPKVDGREFAFGRVNLICGPNGAGKTSLLEAIELWTCGSTLRNAIPASSQARVRVLCQNASEYVVGPLPDRGVYRAREARWYGAHQKRDTIARSFSRFSFFHADAATRLELAPDTDAVSTALQDLVLGEESARLRRQFDSVLVLLKRRWAECERNRRDAEARRGSVRTSMQQIQRPTTDLKNAAEMVSLELRQVGWLRMDTISGAAQASALLPVLAEARALYDGLASDRRCGTSASIASTDRVLRVCEDLVRRLHEARDGINGLQERYDAHACEIASRRSRLLALRRLDEYLRSGAFRLLAHARTLHEAESRNAAIHQAMGMARSVSVDSLAEAIGSYCECERLFMAEATVADEALDLAKKRLSEARSHVGKLNALLSEILTAGRQLVSEDPSSSTCPMCLATYSPEEFRQRVMRGRPPSSNDWLAPLQEQVHQAKQSVLNVQTRLSALRTLGRAAELCTTAREVQNMSVAALLQESRRWPELAESSERDCSSIRADESRLRSTGYSIDELEHLICAVGITAGEDGIPERREVIAA